MAEIHTFTRLPCPEVLELVPAVETSTPEQHNPALLLAVYEHLLDHDRAHDPSCPACDQALVERLMEHIHRCLQPAINIFVAESEI